MFLFQGFHAQQQVINPAEMTGIPPGGQTMMSAQYVQQMPGINMVAAATGINGPLPRAVEQGVGEIAMATANMPNNINNRSLLKYKNYPPYLSLCMSYIAY